MLYEVGVRARYHPLPTGLVHDALRV